MGQPHTKCESGTHKIGIIGPDNKAIILPNNYSCQGYSNDLILPITIETWFQGGDKNGVKYNRILFINIWRTWPVSDKEQAVGTYKIYIYLNEQNYINSSDGPIVTESLTAGFSANAEVQNYVLLTDFVLSKELTDKPGSYTIVPIYNDKAFWASIYVTYKLTEKMYTGTNAQNGSQSPNPNLSLSFKNDKIQIPSIIVKSQTLVDYSDVGDSIFEIYDDVYYYDNKAMINIDHVCKSLYSDNIKITKLEKLCPKIVSVFRGIGETLSSKATYLYNNETMNPNTTLFNFGENILKYSMVKYLLAKILYGKFDIKFLLGKYNNKFLSDLGNSRFCNFVYFFTNKNSEIYDYNRFFLYRYGK